jgi:hypothetical protein
VGSIKKHTAHILCLGGGPNPRRFQQSSKYIFTMYVKTGGVAYAAQRKQSSGTPNEDDKLPTVGDANNLLMYLNNTTDVICNDNNASGGQGDTVMRIVGRESRTSLKPNDIEMQKLIQRLVPYSQALQGSAPHIAFERTKLMAMIPSPIMEKVGSCRWFLTMAPSDKYENRSIEVIQDAIIDNCIPAWEKRALHVRRTKLMEHVIM